MANITTQTIRVDLSTDKVIPSAFTHQNDTARTLEFSIYNKGVPHTMTGNTVKFAYKSPIVDGAYTVITGSGMASGTVSGNKVTVTLPNTYTAISGVGMLTMIITPTSGTVRPVNIRLVVQKSADGDDTVMGASDWPEGLYDYMDNWLEENEPTEIANLKSEINYSNIGEEVLKCDYEMGDINSSGQNSGSSTRVRSVSQISYDNDIIINCLDGYRFRLYRYNPDGTVIGTGGNTYRTGRYMVTKDTLFRVVINTVEGSDPVTLGGARSALTITSNIQTEIDTNTINIIDNDLKTRGFSLIKGGWEYGDIYNGNLTTAVNRIRSASDVTYDRDIKIHVSNGYRVWIYGANGEGTYYKYTNAWVTTMVKISAGVTFRAVIRSESGGEIQSIADVVANIYVDYTEDCLPPYWTDNNYLSDKIEQINSNNSSVEVGTQFAFFTDIHLPANDGYSKELLNRVYKETSVSLGVFGGDVMTAYGVRTDITKVANNWLKYIGNIDMPMLLVHGNHDWTCKTSSSENTGYTENKAFTNYYSFDPMRVKVNRGYNNRYYSYTDDINKIVYIVWDDSYATNAGTNPWGVQGWITAQQVRWMRDVLLSVPNEYNVISFSHAPINSDLSGYSAPNTLIQQLLIGYKNKTNGTATYQSESAQFDFTNAHGNFVCHIAGHCHKDKSSTENGILCITTTCDAMYNDDSEVETRVTGTTSAQAIDVFTIDTDNKTINTVRIGGGVGNRTFTYT